MRHAMRTTPYDIYEKQPIATRLKVACSPHSQILESSKGRCIGKSWGRAFPASDSELSASKTIKTMTALYHNAEILSLQGSTPCVRLPQRPSAASGRQCNPRQRKLDISCSAQSVSSSLRQGRSESRKDRLHVIALISEAVSVNVSLPFPSVDL